DAMFRCAGRTLASTEPMYGESWGAPACPARLLCIASKWLLMLPGWVIDRMRAKCLVSFAIRGCSSLMRLPGTAGATGWDGPRVGGGGGGLRATGGGGGGPAAKQDEDTRLLRGALGSLVAVNACRDDSRGGEAEGTGTAELKKPAAGEVGVHVGFRGAS